MAKIVDYILIAGTTEEPNIFYKDLSKKFKVGSHRQGTNMKVKLNCMKLSQDQNFNISVNFY